MHSTDYEYKIITPPRERETLNKNGFVKRIKRLHFLDRSKND